MPRWEYHTVLLWAATSWSTNRGGGSQKSTDKDSEPEKMQRSRHKRQRCPATGERLLHPGGSAHRRAGVRRHRLLAHRRTRLGAHQHLGRRRQRRSDQ